MLKRCYRSTTVLHIRLVYPFPFRDFDGCLRNVGSTTGLPRRRQTTPRSTFPFGSEIIRFSAMSHSNNSVQLILFIGASLVVFDRRLFVNVAGLEENEEVVDDFDTGTVTYWQGLQTNGSTTFWHLSVHGESLPVEINLLRPPSEEGEGFIEVFPISDSPAQIFSDEFDLLPGAIVEMTYWNFVARNVRNTVLLLYKEIKDFGDETGTKLPIKPVLVYSAPFSTDPSLGWITVSIDLKITEPSKIQLRIDGHVMNTNENGLAVNKIIIKNGLEVNSTTTGSSSTMETSTVDSTTSSSTTQLTTTSSSLSSSSTRSSISPTFDTTTIDSSTAMSSTISTMSISISSTSFTISSSTPFFIVSTTSSTISSSSSSNFPMYTNPTISTSSVATSTVSSNGSSVTSTMPPPTGMPTNQLRDALISVGISIFLFFLFCLLFTVWYKRHRRRAYLIESRQLETGILRQQKQFDHIPSAPQKTVYDSSSISSTNSS